MSSLLEEKSIQTIRFLAADAVQAANSGHPGTPMGAATLAYVLWTRHLRHNPSDPKWFNRDRFILSPGHASTLLYSLLHLTGYDLPLDEIKRFRQWESLTPGHPEHGLTSGVEVTTGPLGQGIANGVGMAIAEQWLAARFNQPDHKIVDHFTYTIVSDGDLQEGVSAEAASLAGTLKLGRLIYLYDSNRIQIEGSTEIAFTENVGKRFEAYGWQVIGPVDGDDLDAVDSAIRAGQNEADRPTLIICRTHIGFGAPTKQDTASAHGEPLGRDELAAAKKTAGWNPDESFFIPADVLAHMRSAKDKGATLEQEWKDGFSGWKNDHPEDAYTFETQLSGDLPEGWSSGLVNLFHADDKPIASREASGKVLKALAPNLPALMGGSADLAPSTKTILKGQGDFNAENHAGRNLHFGVREHAMGSIANGMALHGGVIPYTATFLVFADYMRPALRLAALMEQRVIFVFTHDSIGLGEDGPTHQPIEQLLTLRAIPNLTVIRPADARETAEAWRAALFNQHGPTAIILSRQNLPMLERDKDSIGLSSGAYILWQTEGKPDIILMGSGSETQYALEAGKQLAAQGIKVRVVSFPSWELFEKQTQEYRESVLPKDVRARVAIEAALPLGWEKYVGLDGAIVGLDHFGASAPAATLYEKFGITSEHVVIEAQRLLAQKEIA
ncbi:MAG: transketolase [Chloroflexi bacterium]|nr:transketolase [Chloroflexota bacterium]